MLLGWGSAEDIQLLVGGGQLEKCSLNWTLLVRRRHSSCQTLPQPPSLLPSLVLPGPGREHGPNRGSQAAQHLFAAAGRITALSRGEQDGAALPERGLCGTERPPSDANARRSTHASCDQCPAWVRLQAVGRRDHPAARRVLLGVTQHRPAPVPFHRNTCSLRNEKNCVNSNYF